MKESELIQKFSSFPNNWVEKRLGDIGTISGGGVDKKINPNECPIRLLNFLDVHHNDFINSKMLDYWVTAKKEKVKQCKIMKGDIFFTPSSEMRYDIAVSAVAVENIDDAVYSYHLIRFRLNENWDLRFSLYIFNTRYFLNQAETICEGSGKRYVITLPKFRSMKIRYPSSIQEQQKIAEVLSDIDELISSIEKLIDKKKNLKIAAMQKLLTPKDDWITRKLGDVCTNIFAGGTPSTKDESLWKNGNIMWIQSGLIQDNIIKKEDVLERITEKGLKFSSAKLISPDTTILAMTGATCAKTAYLNFIAATNQSVMAFETNEISSKFLFYIFQNNKKYILQFQAGGAQAAINKTACQNFEFMFPKNKQEQQDIVQILTDIDSEIETLEQELSKYKDLKTGMMQELLTGKTRLI